jgi:cytochrome c oxidase assembly protein subunit 15
MKSSQSTNLNEQQRTSLRFRRLGITTIVAVYLLVLAGGIVRSTGSGMGCPDWPKCFGSWVPPTEASQLPPFYKVDYANKRQLKNEKLSRYLDKLGMSDLATRIRHEVGASEEANFNPVKTWIEYVNRLLGVAVGFLIFLTLVFSIPFLKFDRTIFYLSVLAFVLVGFQGWIGSVVVSTNLLPGIITIHMLLAIAIIFLLIYVVIRSAEVNGQMRIKAESQQSIKRIVVLALMASVLQTLFGTQVRESIDHAIRLLGYEERANWIGSLGLAFYVHRSFSLLILGIHGYLIYQLMRNVPSKGWLFSWVIALTAFVGMEIVTGVVMAYLGIPAFVQPVHLTLAFVILGIQFVIFLLLNKEAIFATQASEAVSAVGAKAFS